MWRPCHTLGCPGNPNHSPWGHRDSAGSPGVTLRDTVTPLETWHTPRNPVRRPLRNPSTSSGDTVTSWGPWHIPWGPYRAPRDLGTPLGTTMHPWGTFSPPRGLHHYPGDPVPLLGTHHTHNNLVPPVSLVSPAGCHEHQAPTPWPVSPASPHRSAPRAQHPHRTSVSPCHRTPRVTGPPCRRTVTGAGSAVLRPRVMAANEASLPPDGRRARPGRAAKD